MGRSLSDLLKVLDDLYKFPGGRTAPSLVDVESPIVIVHDVSREAELASGLGTTFGYFQVRTVMTHVGAGEINAGFDPYDEIADLQDAASRLNTWVWLINAWGTVTVNGIATEAVLGWVNQALGGSTGFNEQVRRMIGIWNTESVTQLQSSASSALFFAGGTPLQVLLPMLIPPRFDGAASIFATSTSTGAGDIVVSTEWWAGPIGVVPPGVT